MFKLAQVEKVTWPVTVSIPQDGGKTTQASFSAEFRIFNKDEINGFVEDGADTIAEALTGWKGVADADGNEIPFAPEAKKQLIGITYVRTALVGAYAEACNGRAAARKNS